MTFPLDCAQFFASTRSTNAPTGGAKARDIPIARRKNRAGIATHAGHASAQLLQVTLEHVGYQVRMVGMDCPTTASPQTVRSSQQQRLLCADRNRDLKVPNVRRCAWKDESPVVPVKGRNEQERAVDGLSARLVIVPAAHVELLAGHLPHQNIVAIALCTVSGSSIDISPAKFGPVPCGTGR